MYAAAKSLALRSAGGGVTTVRNFDHLPVAVVRVDSARALAALASARGVATISLPGRMKVSSTPADLTQIHEPEAVASGYDGAGVSVAVLDTGVDWTLNAAARSAFGDCSGGPGTGSCRIDRLIDAATNDGARDTDATGHHGTNVSGIVAETAPAAHLDVYDVFATGGGSADDGDILGALNGVSRDAAAENIRAVNLSLGMGDVQRTECADSPYSAAFLNLRALGVVPVVAAGNSPYDASGALRQGVQTPACASGALSVGAVYAGNFGRQSWQGPCTDDTTATDQIACFSQTGDLLGLLAPGSVITAAGVQESGTSQAAPHVAGAVADLVSANPRATAQQLIRALTTTGTPITDSRAGAGGRVVNRLDVAAAAVAVQQPAAEVGDAGCTGTALPPNDDGSTGDVALPFDIDFFGTTYRGLFVNNNGNVTFRTPLGTFTPFTIGASTPPIIAPFFADVDTRGSASSPVQYGTTTFGSRQAFCVNWDNVGYYSAHTNKLNSFQLLLVDRGDVGTGDFDIVMNYGALVWETGDASGGANGLGGTSAGAGYSAGDGIGGHFFQFPGSLSHLGLLDNNRSTGLVNGSRGSLLPGRYIFSVRNGNPPGSATISGNVQASDGTPQTAAPVQACPHDGSGSCVVGVTGPDGNYTIVGINAGVWDLTAFPPANSSLLPGRAGPLTVATGAAVVENLVLRGTVGLPAGTTITSHGQYANGVPVLYWGDTLSLATSACSGGNASYAITNDAGTVRSGSLTETPAGSGSYIAAIAPLFPTHGDAVVLISVVCPNGTIETRNFTVYIDPSGIVVDPAGQPIAGATVTLLRADTAVGPFAPVPDGSAVMSPDARSNPETTDGAGLFHWDVIAGYYEVQAAKAGCHAPGGSASSVTSAVYLVPPPATNLSLTLDCGTHADQTITFPAVGDQTFGAGPLMLSATASSGLTVAYSASGQCTLNGSPDTLTLTGAGSCTVTADQSGDAHFNAAPSVTQTFAIGRGSQSITFVPPAVVTYGDPVLQLAATATSGLPVTYSAAGQCTLDAAQRTLTFTAAGTCTVTAAQGGNGDYTAAPDVARVITVAHQSPVVKLDASPATSAFGGSVRFTATVGTVGNQLAAPTGTVTFTVDGAVLAPTRVSGGQATLGTTALGAGVHHVTAAYGGDGDYLPRSTSIGYTVGATTISGRHAGSLKVTGSTLVINATIAGAIVVAPGGALDLENSTVAGSIVASSKPGEIRACKSKVGGAVSIRGATGLVMVGDPGDARCAPNTIRGTLSLIGNLNGVEALGNDVTGGVLASGNAGPGPFPGDTTSIQGHAG